MTTGRPLTPEEQQRLARRERTLKNRAAGATRP